MDVHDLGRLMVRVAGGHVCGQEDVADLVADAVGEEEASDVLPVAVTPTHLLGQLFARRFLRRLARLDASGRHFPAPLVNGVAILVDHQHLALGRHRHDPHRVRLFDDVVDTRPAVRRDDVVLPHAIPGTRPDDMTGDGLKWALVC
jgi:hypothetical protein